MSPELKLITTTAELEALRLELQSQDLIAYDTETTGLNKTDTIIGFSVCFSEDIAYYVVIAYWDIETSNLKSMDIDIKSISRLLEILSKKQLIMHNSVFDCKMTEAVYKVQLMPVIHTDTMILAHLLDENRRVGLKELGRELLGVSAGNEQAEMKASVLANGGSLTKDNYQMYKADWKLLGKYGAKDAWLTYRLFLELVPQLYEQGLDKFFYEESMPLLRGPTYDMNNTGLMVDRDELTTLKKTLEAECLEDMAFINQEIGPLVKERYPGTTKKNIFNIDSNQQLAWLLFDKLGLEFQGLTEAGKEVAKHYNIRPYSPSAKREFIAVCERDKGTVYQGGALINGKLKSGKKIKDPWAYTACDKKTLQKFAPRYKWIARLLEYKKRFKLLSTYVEGIERQTQYGIIYPSFLQHGTTSGRYASRNPNFQNLPRDDKRIKGCIRARPGKVYVGADQSQLEPRVFAYFSGDERLLSAFRGADDFYSVIGMGVYGKTDCIPRKDGAPNAFGIKYKALRDSSKVIALATTYGATAFQLAPTTGKSVEDTQQDIDAYFEEFPKIKEFQLSTHKEAKANGFVTNLFGRKRRMPEAKRINKIYGDLPHEELPYVARQLLNLAVNHKIQSTGASIVNRGAIRFYELKDQAGIEAKIVLQVHDSLIVECNEADAENIALLLQEAMENTVQLEGIAFEAKPLIGKTLAKV